VQVEGQFEEGQLKGAATVRHADHQVSFSTENSTLEPSTISFPTIGYQTKVLQSPATFLAASNPVAT
jgi:hypothetical protein